MKTLFVLAALTLSATASADVICSQCPASDYGMYLGPHWKGDQSTFSGSWGSNPGYPNIDHIFLLDVNENATLSITLNGIRGLGVDVHSDFLSVCPTVGAPCTLLAYDEPLGPGKVRKLRLGVVPGRYVLHIQGPPGSYTGTVAVTRP